MTENPAPPTGDTPRSQLPALDRLLKDLHGAVAVRMPDRPPIEPRFRVVPQAIWTRVTKSGEVQVGRRDARALQQLAEATGPIENPRQHKRITAALENVIAAQAQLIADPTRELQSRTQPRIVLMDAGKVVASSAAFGTLVGVGDTAPDGPLSGNTYVDAAMQTLPNAIKFFAHVGDLSPVGIGVVGGAMGIGIGSLGVWADAQAGHVLGEGVERAWAQLKGAEICAAVGVADRLPNVASGFGSTRMARATAGAHQLVAELGAYTGRADAQGKAAALTELVQTPPAERADAVVDSLVRAASTTLEEVTPQTRAKAADRLHGAIHERATSLSLKVKSLVDGAVGVIRRDAPAGIPPETILPKAVTMDKAVDPGQSEAMKAAFGHLPAGGQAAGSSPVAGDGHRPESAQAPAKTRDPNQIS